MNESKAQETTYIADYGPFTTRYYILWDPQSGFQMSSIPIIPNPSRSVQTDSLFSSFRF